MYAIMKRRYSLYIIVCVGLVVGVTAVAVAFRVAHVRHYERLNAMFIVGRAALHYWDREKQWPEDTSKLLNAGDLTEFDGYIDSIPSYGVAPAYIVRRVEILSPSLEKGVLERDGTYYVRDSNEPICLIRIVGETNETIRAINDAVIREWLD